MAIDVDEIPQWVPGALTFQDPGGDWSGPALRGYAYPGHVVDVPPISDHVIIAYLRGSTLMRRRASGPWSEERVRPGDITLLTSGAFTQWEWPECIEVVHTYVGAEQLASTGRDMFDREISEVELADIIKAKDNRLFRTVASLAREAREAHVGSRLLVDSLTVQLNVQLLRNHAHVEFATHTAGGLTPRQMSAVRDYIAANLHRNVSLEELASTASLSRFHFSRQFRVATGSTPHEFVLTHRLERVKELLRRTRRPIAVIAQDCGFADQSHLTRVFKKRFAVTPGDFRTREH